MPLEEAARGILVGVRPLDLSLGERLIADPAIDALARKLLAQRALASWPGPISRLHPRPRECRVVDHPELGEPHEAALDQVGPVAMQ